VTAVLAILSKIWPYLLAAALGAAIGGWTTHGVDTIALNRQKAAYASYQQKVADQAAAGERAAREALQKQIDTAHQTDQRNETIIHDLHARADSAESDRDLARRLLNSALGPISPASHRLPEAPNQPGATGTGRTGSGPSLETEVAAAIGECERNSNRLDALIAQIKPQVEP